MYVCIVYTYVQIWPYMYVTLERRRILNKIKIYWIRKDIKEGIFLCRR